MLKKILSAVGVVVAGFVVVVSVVYWQLRRVEDTLHETSLVDVPLYRATVAVSERTAELEKLVATSFLSLTQGELDDRRQATRGAIESLTTSVKRLDSATFSAVHSLTTTNSALPPTKEPATTSVGTLIGNLITNTTELGTIAQRTVDLAGEQLQMRQSLEASKEELSKVYRKAFPLAKVDEKSFATLSRALITTFYSSSTRDLNFVGRSKFKEGVEGLTKTTLTPENKELLDSLTTQFNKTFDSALATAAAKADWTLFADRIARARQQTEQLRRFAENQFEAGQSGLTTDTRQTITASLWLSITTIIVGTVIAFLIARSITRRVSTVAERLKNGANEVSRASEQMEATSTQLSEGANSQAASLEETSASLTEMASMTKQNSFNADSAKGLSVDTRAAAETGSNEIKEMEIAMAAIRESSNSIGKIVKSIDEIAFQTNILALNAAVEAARAGEAGLGFAVVADEVRNLAQRSAVAARETAEKIQDSIAKSERGAVLSGKVAQSLQSIVTKAQKVDELVGEIATASKEQSDGVALITTAVNRVDKVTQQSASNAEESATAAAELRAQATSLCESIEDLTQIVGSGRGSASNLHPSAIASVQPAHNSAPAPRPTTQPYSAPKESVERESLPLPLPPQSDSAMVRGETPTVTSAGNFKDF